MENTDYNTLENLKNDFEGKKMLAKRESALGEKREITIDSFIIINEGNKDVIKCNYSWHGEESLGVINIEELLNNYELKETNNWINDCRNDAMENLNN
jgi:hypothetical protein